ncbi:adenosine deaminase [compost metagenome]
MNANYLAVASALALSREELVQLARNGIAASFISTAEKERLSIELEQYARSH